PTARAGRSRPCARPRGRWTSRALRRRARPRVSLPRSADGVGHRAGRRTEAAGGARGRGQVVDQRTGQAGDQGYAAIVLLEGKARGRRRQIAAEGLVDADQAAAGRARDGIAVAGEEEAAVGEFALPHALVGDDELDL